MRAKPCVVFPRSQELAASFDRLHGKFARLDGITGSITREMTRHCLAKDFLTEVNGRFLRWNQRPRTDQAEPTSWKISAVVLNLECDELCHVHLQKKQQKTYK